MPPKRQAGDQEGSAAKRAKVDTEGANKTCGALSDSSGFCLANYLNDPSWTRCLSDEMAKPYFKKTEEFLSEEYARGVQIFPPREHIFSAFNLTPLDKVTVVILGQDPYHDDGQAHGLSFSVKRGVKVPPSLRNMYKELTADIEGFEEPEHGNLEYWAEQGVLLLNATLTVQAHKPNSHSGIGWQMFTDAVIRLISSLCSGVTFLLMGGFAQKKAKLIDDKKHMIIKCAHPSPLSVTKFRGCRCFSAVNRAVELNGKQPIDWKLPI